MDLSLLATYKLPEPNASWTIPTAVGLGLIALYSLVKKLIVLALVLAVLAGGFVAYQNGAFDKWVDRGRSLTDQIQNG
jgi:hypothetical protein